MRESEYRHSPGRLLQDRPQPQTIRRLYNPQSERVMKQHENRSISGAVATLLGLALLAANAANAASETKGAGLPLWEVGIGAAAYHQPNYPGSDVRSTTRFPFPYVIYRGDWFRIDRSLQGILYETRNIKLDFSAGGEFATPLFGL